MKSPAQSGDQNQDIVALSCEEPLQGPFGFLCVSARG